MLAKFNRRMKSQEGFTLIELLIVLIIIGILVAIAVPSYLGFRDRADNRAAQANVRTAVPAAEAFYELNETYTGMSVAALQSFDAGLKLTNVVVPTGGATYCLESTHNGDPAGRAVHRFNGPGGEVVAGACP